MKTQQQIEFEQSIKSLDMQFQIFQNPKSTSKLTQARLDGFEGMLKNLKKVYDRMEERMKANMRNKNYNEYDIKNKLKNYGDSMNKMRDRFRKISEKIVDVQKKQLFTNRSVNPTSTQLSDYARINDHVDRVKNINKQAQQTLGIYNEVINETNRQNQVLDDIHGDAGEFEHELGMADQLMRVISNRELLTKFILVALVFFLGLADFLILLLKIM